MEISPFLGALIGNILVGGGIILVIFITKIIKNKLINYLEYITALTVGLLLGIIFLGFIPELTTSGEIVGSNLGIFILIGIFIFYLLELFLHWHHCKDLGHGYHCKDLGHGYHCNSHHVHEHSNGMLMFGGTMLHNAFHGIVLFSAFAIDINFGIVTTFAILLHSIPQNIVNYIMNHKNIKYAYFAAFGGILGALITFPFSSFLITNKFYILAIITGGLLYTSLADIFPEFKGKGTNFKKLSYFVFIILGIFCFLGFENLVEEGDSHRETKTHSHFHFNDVLCEDHETHDEGETCEGHHEEDNKFHEYEHECIENNGKWIFPSNECEGVSKDICEQIGGNFNECASACRNNPEAEGCITVCIPICEFNK